MDNCTLYNDAKSTKDEKADGIEAYDVHLAHVVFVFAFLLFCFEPCEHIILLKPAASLYNVIPWVVGVPNFIWASECNV